MEFFKKLKLSLVALALAGTTYAQSDAINYQAVARDAQGEVIAEQAVRLRINILKGSNAGASQYEEVHLVSTNQFGLFNLKIGNGTVSSGGYNTIDWSADTYFVQVEMDATGGTSYTFMGTSEMVAVPYALHAKTAGNVFSGDYNDLSNTPQNLSDFTNDLNIAGGDSTDELQTLSLSGQTLTISDGNSITLPSYDDGDSIVLRDLINTNTAAITNIQEGIGDTALAVNGRITATNTELDSVGGDVDNLKAVVADIQLNYDQSDSNEFQSLSISGDALSISDGNSVDLSKYNDNTDSQALSLDGDSLSISNGNKLDLSKYKNDAAQTIDLTGDTLEISGGNKIALTTFRDADDQTLSIDGDTLSITGGNSVVLSAGTDNQTLSISNDTISIEDGNYVVLPAGNGGDDTDSLYMSGDTLFIDGGNSVVIPNASIGGATTVSSLGVGGGLSSSLSNGLVAYYPFNGNASDESTNSNDGTVNGAILTTDRFGNSNSSYDFDGSDDHITISSPTWIGDSEGTFSAWIKPTVGSAMIVFGKKGSDGCCGAYKDVVEYGVNSSGNIWGRVYDDQNPNYSVNGPTTTMSSGEWYHVVYSVSSSETKFYVNGTLDTSFAETIWGTDLDDQYDEWYIGQSDPYGTGSGNKEFDGSIDEIRIYNRALSASEISELYNESEGELQLAGSGITFSDGTTQTTKAVDTDDQTLSISGNDLTISEGNTVTLPSASADFDQAITINESGAAVDFRVEGDTDANLLFIDGSTDMIGIGTSSPTRKLDVNSTNDGVVADFRVDDGSDDAGLLIYAYTDDYSTAYVQNTAMIYTGSETENLQLTASGGGNGEIRFTTGGYTSSFERMKIDSNGNVGIGTSAPATNLDVNGNIHGDYLYLGDGTNNPHIYFNQSGGTSTDGFHIMYDDGANERLAIVETGEAERISILDGGNVGVGTTSPTALLHVNGSALATAWNTSSDARFKENVEQLPNALNNVLAMRGTSYDFKTKEFEERNFPEEKQIGFIAQELREIYPELVTEDEDGYLSVDYAKVTAVLVEAIKAQQAMIQQLESDKADLSASIKDLNTRIDLLFNLVQGETVGQ